MWIYYNRNFFFDRMYIFTKKNHNSNYYCYEIQLVLFYTSTDLNANTFQSVNKDGEKYINNIHFAYFKYHHNTTNISFKGSRYRLIFFMYIITLFFHIMN